MFKKFKKMIVPLLITFLLLSIVVMGAPTYVNVGPTTDFEGDVGVPSGSGYYINDILFSTMGLIDIAALEKTDGGIIVGDGTNFVLETGVTARASLGLIIGSDVQAYDAGLLSLATLTYASDSFIKVTAEDTYVVRTIAEVITDLALDSDDLSDVTSIAMLDENEDITGAWTVSTGSIAGVDATEFGYLADITAFGASIIDDADEATFKATVNLEIGTDVLAYQAVGIADNNLIEIDDTDTAVDDYCKLTANGIVGRSYAEVKTDLGIDLSLYYLKTEIDTLSKVETIYTKDIIDSDELAALKFTDLTDTPADYAGHGLELLQVNAGSSAVEFSGKIIDGVLTDDENDIPTSHAVYYFCETTKNYKGKNYYSALGSDHTYSDNADTDSQPVGEAVAFGDLLYPDWTAGEWLKADADLAAKMPGLRIALESKTDGQTCLMLVKGYIRDDNWDFGAAMIYASVTPGAMSSTAPTESGDQLQRVGVAKSADILFFDPSIDVGEI